MMTYRVMGYEQPPEDAFHFAMQLNVEEYFWIPRPMRQPVNISLLSRPMPGCLSQPPHPASISQTHPKSPTGDISPTIYELRYDREIARMAE